MTAWRRSDVELRICVRSVKSALRMSSVHDQESDGQGLSSEHDRGVDPDESAAPRAFDRNIVHSPSSLHTRIEALDV